jgi:Cation transporter/ATPase, N-terminus
MASFDDQVTNCAAPVIHFEVGAVPRSLRRWFGIGRRLMPYLKDSGTVRKNTARPKAPESKPGSKPDSKDDLKSMPMAGVEKKLGSSPNGLTQAEAEKRLTQYGPNEIEEKKTNPFLKFLSYFSGPIPWMIEVAVILSGVVGHWPDFSIILILLVANGVVGFWEERRVGRCGQNPCLVLPRSGIACATVLKGKSGG